MSRFHKTVIRLTAVLLQGVFWCWPIDPLSEPVFRQSTATAAVMSVFLLSSIATVSLDFSVFTVLCRWNQGAYTLQHTSATQPALEPILTW
jgi:hypothetical protein